MILFLSGATHTGKTLLSQKLLEKYHIPYLSLDHLKMGLIRSGNTALTPMDDDKLTDYLWPIAREMAKTAIENRQHLIIEGCYIPFDWRKDFGGEYLPHIRALWLIMSEGYIRTHFAAIREKASAIEARLDDSGLNEAALIQDNQKNLEGCREYGCEYFLMEDHYPTPEEVLRHDLSAVPL